MKQLDKAVDDFGATIDEKMDALIDEIREQRATIARLTRERDEALGRLAEIDRDRAEHGNHAGCRINERRMQEEIDRLKDIIGKKRFGEHMHGIDVCAYCAAGDLAVREVERLRRRASCWGAWRQGR